jgi:hypothetical protein
MRVMKTFVAMLPLLLVGLLAGGCGGSKPSSAGARPATTTTGSATTATTNQSPGALQAEAQSTATGDIPDNQAFVVFRDRAAGYSMKYPEGWAQSGGGRRVVIRDKNNIVRIVVQRGALPTAAAVSRELAALPGTRVETAPKPFKVPSGPAIKIVYSTESAPNAVTGKRVRLVVNRYYVTHAGNEAIVDLGTPQGVDNVDAYRLMIESFRWR